MKLTTPTEPRFVRPEPYVVPPDDLRGFTAGVLRIEWTQPAESFEFAGRAGRMFTARIVECRTRRETPQSDAVSTSLQGLVVRAPDGALSRVAGVEMFCSMIQYVGAPIGLLLVPVEES